MSAIGRLFGHNTALADRPAAGSEAQPALRLAILTCMDARIDIFGALGLAVGEAHILRNAGGLVTEDVIRSLAISQRRLGTREVMVIQHTNCGMQTLTDEEFADELRRHTGVAPPFATQAFTDLEQSVRQSVQMLRSSPFLLHRESIRRFVYDVNTHRLQEVSGE